jgi:hypothetical protein
MDEKKRQISDAIFMISVKHPSLDKTTNQSTSIPLYIIEDDSGHEADVASHTQRIIWFQDGRIKSEERHPTVNLSPIP